MALCSVPFAFTERFFYPSYWEPVFLFDLVKTLGFGVEDLLFVTGLSAFTSTVYAFCFRLGYVMEKKRTLFRILCRCLGIFGLAFILIGIVVVLKIEMIYGSFGIMSGIGVLILFLRKDLIIPCLTGGVLSVIVYSLPCFVLKGIFPDIFKLTWHTEKFLNFFIAGIPVEELMYGFSAGAIATVFYPFVFGMRFDRLLQNEKLQN
jgi:hypothetical protein